MLEEKIGGPKCNYLNPSRQSVSMMRKKNIENMKHPKIFRL
jgi:hypothetical protein